jgi:hypothetical protein
MAREDENDMTDGARDSETTARRVKVGNKEFVVPGTDTARRRAIEGDAPPSAEMIGDAVAKALERQRNAPPLPEKPLPEIVRASVRCGYETVRRVLSDGSAQLVTKPAEVTFKASETSDGREYTVPHGRPVKLKRDAFLRYQSEGKVVAG